MPNFPLSHPHLLIVAVSQALLMASGSLHAADSDRVIARDGAVIDVHDLDIVTTGDNVHAVQATTGGKVHAANMNLTTSGKDAHGVLVDKYGSEFTSRAALSIVTSGDGASGLKVGTLGQANVQGANIVTHGKSASGVFAFSNGKIDLGNASITTLGDQSHGILAVERSVVSGRDLAIQTQGVGANGVDATWTSVINLGGSSIATSGDRSHGVYAGKGSSVDLRDGSRVATHGKEAHGLYAHGQDALIRLTDSTVETYGEGSAGVLVEQGGRVEFNHSRVSAQGIGAVGAQLSGGSLAFTGSSLQAQAAPALNIRGVDNHVLIDSSYVGSSTGPAIKMESGAAASIVVRNGSTLSADGGRGELLDLAPDSELDMVIDNSVLHGNLTITDSSLVNVRLQNGTRFTGQMNDVAQVHLDSGVRWDINGDSRIKSLSLNGGLVSFHDSAGYHRLSMEELSGNGSFGLKLDMNNRLIDVLEIQGPANGDHVLNIKNSGVEPVSGFHPLMVVDTAGGDAKFSLLGSRVDLGAYSYNLEQQGDDWFLTGEGREVSPSTRTVQSLFNSAPTVWYGEMSTLRSRMGEVRGHGQGGGWMRSYGNKYQVSGSGDSGYQQYQHGISMGADGAITLADSLLLVGVFGGYSKSDLSLSRGSSGTVESFYVGTYGTWMDDNGYYLDSVLKLNKFQNRADVVMSDFSKVKGKYDNYGLGASLEAGRQIQMTEQLYIAPFTQLSAVAIQGQSFSLDNQLRASNEATRSVVGKLGVTAEQRYEVFRPYVKVALAQEFIRDNEVKVNGHKFKNDLYGSRGELGAGLGLALSSNLQLHADFDYMKGRNIEQPWGANVGLRYAFD